MRVKQFVDTFLNEDAEVGHESFAIVTAWVGKKDAMDREGKYRTNDENHAAMKSLSHDISTMQLSHIKLRGYKLDDQNSSQYVEPSYLVHGINKAQAEELRDRHGQNFVIYSGPETHGGVHGLWANGRVEHLGRPTDTALGKHSVDPSLGPHPTDPALGKHPAFHGGKFH